jgi:hypothetical protein
MGWVLGLESGCTGFGSFFDGLQKIHRQTVKSFGHSQQIADPHQRAPEGLDTEKIHLAV